MKIILNQDVLNLGEEGDICDVAKGYARNYLIAQKLAVSYTKQNLVTMKSKSASIDARKEDKRRDALGLKEKLEEEELKFMMSSGESGKLFGSVTSALIHEELEKRGYTLERKKIEIPDNHIRFTGEYSVKIKLYGKQEAHVKVLVEPEGT